MKVKELIDALSKLDPEGTVEVRDNYGEWSQIDKGPRTYNNLSRNIILD